MCTNVRTGLATVSLLLAAAVSGCTGTGEGAAAQMRSAFGAEQLPDQYEPPVIESNDEFQPTFGD